MAGHTIMIIEDDADLAAMVAAYLEQYGSATVRVTDFRQAEQQFLAVRPQLVLMDVTLPYQDGFHLTRVLRRHSAVPILFLSSRVGEMERVLGMESGGDAFDLKVAEGEFTGIMGPSGSGKTTLLQILGTIDTPTSGEVFVQGQSLAQLQGAELALFRRRRLGFIFQEFNLLDALTLRENIIIPLVLERRPAAEIAQRAEGLAARLASGTCWTSTRMRYRAVRNSGPPPPGRNLGLSVTEIRRIIGIQIAVIFGLPSLFAAVTTLVIQVRIVPAVGPVAVPVLAGVLLIYGLLQGAYFAVTRRTYVRRLMSGAVPS